MLYIVATPIGNLEDVSARALRILGEVDLIACEDTRQTRKLLDRYGIAKPLISYHEHNERTRAEELIGNLLSGKNIALVSDAGTPLIADPGYRLVEMAREKGIVVSPVPGPSALLAALSASGLPTDAFSFRGFFASKSAQKRHFLEEMRHFPGTVVAYETPHRVLETLEDIAEVLGPRPVVLARELTKVHEEFLRGTADEIRDVLAKRPSVKGEMVIMIGKSDTAEVDETPLDAAVEKLVDAGLSRMDAFKTVAKQRGLSKREVYKKMNER